MAKYSPKHPVMFEEFFELGMEESSSPFLTPRSRKWGINLSLKASLLAAVLLIISFVCLFVPQLVPLSHFLLIAVYFLAGIPSLIESIDDLLIFDVNIDVLMTIAAFSSVLIGSGMEGGLLLVLFAISGAIEQSVEAKAKSSISSLRKLSPTKACVIEEDGTLLERSINDITVNTKILVKAGQMVPLDGLVIDGISSVNMVHLTGENLPITMKKGDQVPAGARNMEGALTVNVTHTSADSTLTKIIKLVTQAQEAKPNLQRWFDKLSRGYAITIILLAFFFAISLPFFIGLPFLGREGSLYRGLAFLIAASPCALILAIPIAYLSAISACAKKGILMKGGVILDSIAGCRAIAFDKTGTLTTGSLTCEGVESLSGNKEDLPLALSIAYTMERNAVHPIAKSILDYAQQKKISTTDLKEFRAVPGYGVEGIASTAKGDLPVYIGHADYILTKVDPAKSQALKSRADAIQSKGELIAVMLLGSEIYLFRFHDTLRAGMKETIQEIRNKYGWRAVMLTGDHETSARRIADEVGIDEYRAGLRPEQKLQYVSKMAEETGLAMVGDGINDAPALARASVGIAMGKVGSTAALDAADIVLLNDNIELLGWLIAKSYKTQTVVRENLLLAVTAILIASLPALAGIIPLWLAVVMHEGGTVLVGLNALRLLRS